MPSLLIESGFMTNAEEEQYLMSDHGQNTIANNIVDAIQNYKTMYETKRVNIENANNTSNDSDNSQAKLPTQKGPNTPKGNKNFVPNEDTFEKYYVVQFAVATKKLPLKEHPFSKFRILKSNLKTICINITLVHLNRPKKLLGLEKNCKA